MKQNFRIGLGDELHSHLGQETSQFLKIVDLPVKNQQALPIRSPIRLIGIRTGMKDFQAVYADPKPIPG